jgi:hypothetical protein
MQPDLYADDIDKRKWMRTQRSWGPAWDRAVAFGIDVSLIESSLEMSFEQRLIQLEGMLALQEELRPEGPVFGHTPTP